MSSSRYLIHFSYFSFVFIISLLVGHQQQPNLSLALWLHNGHFLLFILLTEFLISCISIWYHFMNSIFLCWKLMYSSIPFITASFYLGYSINLLIVLFIRLVICLVISSKSFSRALLIYFVFSFVIISNDLVIFLLISFPLVSHRPALGELRVLEAFVAWSFHISNFYLFVGFGVCMCWHLQIVYTGKLCC